MFRPSILGKFKLIHGYHVTSWALFSKRIIDEGRVQCCYSTHVCLPILQPWILCWCLITIYSKWVRSNLEASFLYLLGIDFHSACGCTREHLCKYFPGCDGNNPMSVFGPLQTIIISFVRLSLDLPNLGDVRIKQQMLLRTYSNISAFTDYISTKIAL